MELRRISIVVLVLAGAALSGAGGCSKGSYSPTSPTPPSSGGSGSGATITITASGVTPNAVTVSVGQQVTFINNSTQAMAVTSDPHPIHTDCPAINTVGTLLPGQTRLTAGFPSARNCGFHDHDLPDDPTRRGTITIR